MTPATAVESWVGLCQDMPPWDAFLQFTDDQTERAYKSWLASRNALTDLSDSITVILLCLAHSVYCVLTKPTPSMYASSFILLLMTIRIRLLREPAWYTRRRTRLIIVMWGLSSLMTPFFSWRVVSKIRDYTSVQHSLFGLIFETSVHGLLVMPWGAVRFRLQILLQFVCMMISSVWVYWACTRHTLGTEHVGDFLGSAIRDGVVSVSTLGFLGRHAQVCIQCAVWVPLAWVHAIFGFVVPCTIAYCRELQFMMRFLIRERRGVQPGQLKQQRLVGVALSFFLSFMVSQVLWFVLEGAERISCSRK